MTSILETTARALTNNNIISLRALSTSFYASEYSVIDSDSFQRLTKGRLEKTKRLLVRITYIDAFY